MCHETPATIAPRIIALLSGESLPWTGNEILGRIATGDFPCEAHFDETIRQLVRERKLTSDSDPLAATLSSTTRCRLAYVLAPEAKTPTTVVKAAPPPEKPKPPSIGAPPPPPPPPVAPALPSPAARLEAIGRLREEKARVERDWFARHGADCFRRGSPEFLKALFLQARVHGLLPRLRDALEKSRGRRIEDFERACENLLQINDRDGTIPVGMLDAGVKLDLMSYVTLDLDRAEREIRDGKEGNPSNARELLVFLKTALDNPSLARPPAASKPVASLEDLPSRSGSTRVEVPPAVDALVHRMISKKPGDRFETAPDLIRAIDGIPAAPPRVETAARPPSSAAKKAVLSLVGWSIVLAAALGAAWHFRPKKHEPALPPVVVRPPSAVEPPKKDPETPVKRDPDPARVTPAVEARLPDAKRPDSAPPRDPRLALLTDHVPDAKELELLEQLLALSRATLAARCGYAFEDAAEKILAFPRGRSLPPWVELFAEAERERMQAALRAFQARPLLEGRDDRLLQLRDGRELRGKVVGEIGGRITVETADGGREGLMLALVSPSTFPAARGPALEALLLRSAAGDATGALPLLAGLGELHRRRLAPILLDQAIEETLRTGDLKAIAGFEPPADQRAVADSLLQARMKALSLERDAAWALLHVDEGESLKRLLTSLAATRSGARAAVETLEAFEKSLPSDEKFELVSPSAWGTWDPDIRDAPGGTVVFDKGKNVYVLAAASAKEQVRLLKKLKGAERGYRIRWSFGAGASDAAAFMVALSFTRWLEAGPRSITLFRADKEGEAEKISTVRKTELPERLSGGLLQVFPRAGLVLVYLNGRLLFALTEKEYALGSGLQLGMSGGSVTIESIRVLDRARD
jgi:hypothetical protein